MVPKFLPGDRIEFVFNNVKGEGLVLKAQLPRFVWIQLDSGDTMKLNIIQHGVKHVEEETTIDDMLNDLSG